MLRGAQSKLSFAGLGGAFLRMFLGFLEGNMEVSLVVEWSVCCGDEGGVD